MEPKMNTIEQQIREAGRKLAAIHPESQALTSARGWWKSGRLNAYSNQDFDILNSLNQAILKAA